MRLPVLFHMWRDHNADYDRNKHEQKAQDKTQNKTFCSKSHKAIQNKNNIRSTAFSHYFKPS